MIAHVANVKSLAGRGSERVGHIRIWSSPSEVFEVPFSPVPDLLRLSRPTANFLSNLSSYSSYMYV